MINPHSVGGFVTMCAGIFGAFVACAVAMLAASKADHPTKRRSRRAQRP
jgi:hypothetical protein